MPPAAKPTDDRPLSKAEAESLAKDEGLTLVVDEKSKTGYKNVHRYGSKLFSANRMKKGPDRMIGRYLTPHAAALAFARDLGKDGIADLIENPRNSGGWKIKPPGMTAEAAIQLALDEGLTLQRANGTGSNKYRFVYRQGIHNPTRPFWAQIDIGRDPARATSTKNSATIRKNFGSFETAEEAALVVARFLRDHPIEELKAKLDEIIAAQPKRVRGHLTSNSTSAAPSAASSSSIMEQQAVGSRCCGTYGCTLPDQHSGLHQIRVLLNQRSRKRSKLLAGYSVDDGDEGSDEDGDVVEVTAFLAESNDDEDEGAVEVEAELVCVAAT